MKLKRVIPIVLLKDGLLVRSEKFKYYQAIGDPLPTIKRLSDWNADEIIILNIGSNKTYDSRRDDKLHNAGTTNFATLIKEVARFCYCPLTIGGGIRSLEQMEELFEAGADKIGINSIIFEEPELVKYAAKRYGSQAITASIDFKYQGRILTAWVRGGKVNTGVEVKAAINHAKSIGVGEILISSVERDGSSLGYDQQLLKAIQEASSNTPIIINSGATKVDHFLRGLKNESISAVAASNVFYFTELSYINIKNDILKSGFENIRESNPGSKYCQREPVVENSIRERLMKKQKEGSYFEPKKYSGALQQKIKYCRRCLYSSSSATPMMFDKTGLCMGCRTYETKRNYGAKEYHSLKEKLKKEINIILSSGKRMIRNYDCIVSVSGGKDSYYQTHYVKNILKLNPLLVTYNGNNYTEVGWRNLWNMREAFGCDHIVVSPSVKTLKKLNRLGFVAMGDMNWHAHVGIFTTAPRIALQAQIPIIFWGEHGYADLCGQFSMCDFPEMNYRERTEHAGRGYDWNFFVGLEGITEKEMETWRYPQDEELMRLGLRQFYLGHYIPWESNEHLNLMVEKYNFLVSDEPFERTYRRGSNLDDMHENGVHDYLKYIKFGYGRCTDHASKDIRSGDITRKEGLKLAQEMDKIKPKDLSRWLEYVSMSEAEFDRIADHFRDPRVWKWDEKSGWTKTNEI